MRPNRIRGKRSVTHLLTFRSYASLVSILLVIVLCIHYNRSVQAQDIIGSFSTSTPEAAMMFLDPGLVNPAVSSGVLSLLSNPGGLSATQRPEVDCIWSVVHSTTGQFQIIAVDTIATLSLDTDIRFRRRAGLTALGLANTFGPLAVGIAIMQPRYSAFEVIDKNIAHFSNDFQVNTLITEEETPDLPVDSISVNWEVQNNGTANIYSDHNINSVSIRPLVVGFSFRTGKTLIGAAIKHFHIKNNSKPASLRITTQRDELMTGVTGTPEGMNGSTGLPWNGELNGIVSIDDTLMQCIYFLELEGNRWAATLGSVFDFDDIELGLTVEMGFRGKLRGRYIYEMIKVNAIPDSVRISEVDISVNPLSEVNGTAQLTLSRFVKDTTRHDSGGNLDADGYFGFSLGARIRSVGLFLGSEIPTGTFDLGAGYFGIYVERPFISSQNRIRFGLFHRSDFMYARKRDFIPLRSTTQLGVGSSLKIPFDGAGGVSIKSCYLHLNVRSSLSWPLFKSVLNNKEEVSVSEIPKLAETIVVGCGLHVSF